jgi:hypothetical protein
MNGKTGGGRVGRRAGGLAAVAAVAVLTAACGVVHISLDGASSGNTALGGSATFAQELALARCMRGHGAPYFPDPSPSSGFSLTTSPNGPAGAVDVDSSRIQAAYGACRHLLPGGGPSVAQLRQDAQREQQAFPGLLKFAQCMRGHGVPGFPDPALNSQAPPNGAGISPSSPRFRAAVSACRPVLPAGVHLNLSTHKSVHVPG